MIHKERGDSIKHLNEVRWGIIGCGDVTEVKSGPALQKVENSQLVAVMRRNGELAKDYARRHDVPNWYDNADQLINDPLVNAVYIATPPAFHMEYAVKAANAGKVVYVEKPMALNPNECQMMIDSCKQNAVPLFVAYYRRELDRFLKVKEIIDQGLIGDTRFVSTVQYQPTAETEMDQTNPPWRIQPDLAGGGLFFDLASHTLDILDFLLGPIEQVRGFANNQAGHYHAEDIVTGTYSFRSGVQGIGSWCFNALDREDRNEIIGSKGKVTFATFGEGPIQLSVNGKITEWGFKNPVHVQQPLIQTIVDQLTGNNEGICPSNGESGIRTNWVMEQMVTGKV
ncbi:Gfo/Idh/MocA family protein [Aquibacillus saliphilus]|uniref:Gfo/Idh/MocA family protein n=1 Tax=Aquibacillus saliphilus TaxID=1909422 RepID=UPI001CF0D543|nr:Gfo/Idh/MocA family oxidoreductase [Aquibacillus saliphilus]